MEVKDPNRPRPLDGPPAGRVWCVRPFVARRHNGTHPRAGRPCQRRARCPPWPGGPRFPGLRGDHGRPRGYRASRATCGAGCVGAVLCPRFGCCRHPQHFLRMAGAAHAAEGGAGCPCPRRGPPQSAGAANGGWTARGASFGTTCQGQSAAAASLLLSWPPPRGTAVAVSWRPKGSSPGPALR